MPAQTPSAFSTIPLETDVPSGNLTTSAPPSAGAVAGVAPVTPASLPNAIVATNKVPTGVIKCVNHFIVMGVSDDCHPTTNYVHAVGLAKLPGRRDMLCPFLRAMNLASTSRVMVHPPPAA